MTLKAPISLFKGDDFNMEITYSSLVNDVETTVNLTGYTITFDILESKISGEEKLFSLTNGNGLELSNINNGVIGVHIPRSISAELLNGISYVYELAITSPTSAEYPNGETAI